MNHLQNETIMFCGLPFRGLKTEQLFVLADKEFQHVITVNADYLQRSYRDKRLFNLLQQECTTFDGQLMYLLAKQKYPQNDFEKISGSDLIFDVCNYCKLHNKSLFLLGGDENANNKCVNNLNQQYGIRIGGYSPPYMNYPFTGELSTIIRDKIKSFSPDYLFVGFGSPKQDYWITDNAAFLRELNVCFAVGSGGTFELTSGELKRAPLWIQCVGMEWFFRLLQEPQRLWKRYLFGNIRCLKIYITKEWLKR